MGVPDGYNTVPNFVTLSELAAGLGLSANGNIFHVDSGSGADTNGGASWDEALATLDAAINKCTANNGDVILVAPGHAETWTTTGAKVVADVPGVTIIGIGEGADRPTFTFGHTGTTWTISAASVKMKNLLLLTNIDQLVTFGTISGADCDIDVEVRDTTDKEVLDAFTVTGDRFKAKILHCGYIGGDANLTTLKMTGVDNADIDIVALGKAGTAVVQFIGTACTNVLIRGTFLVTGTATLAKNVVDTVGGSTWLAQGHDLAAGCSFSGGSGGALQKDDVGAIAALIGALANTGGAATLAGILGDVNNVSIATSLAKLGTIVNSGGTATIGGILGDLANVTIATWLQKIGTLVNTGGTAEIGAILGDVLNSSIAARLIAAQVELDKIGVVVNTGGTAKLGDVLGDLANMSVASRLDSATKKTTIADGTTIPNNAQAAAGLLATATGGAVMIEEIIWQRGADNFVGPTNYAFSTDNVNGLTGAAAPNGLAILAKFNAAKTGTLSLDGTTKQLPFVLESGKKLYIHGDDAVTSAGAATDFYIKYRRLAAGAYLA